jgi:hypothetical protein
MQKLAAWALDGTSVKPIVSGVPAGVELMERANSKGERVWILINHGSVTRTVDAGAGATDLLTGGSDEHLTLAPHDVAIVEPGRR